MKRSVYSKKQGYQIRLHSGVRNMLYLVLCCSVLIFYACGESSTGVNGGNGNGNGNGGGNEIGTEATFDNIQQIFTANCTSCHGGTGESGVRLNNYQNVVESVGNQYNQLVVQAGDAGASPLVDKIESDNPQFGVRMPQNGPYLSDQRISQIRTWINNGAENDQSSNGNNGNGNGSGGY